MLTIQQETIGICLFELPDKDQAVIQRVITFGASQGKNYALHPETGSAKIIIALDDIQLPSNTALNIRIGEPSLPCDLVLQRPLLVTRVMRALDDAAQMLKSRSGTVESVATDHLEPVISEIAPPHPAPPSQAAELPAVPEATVTPAAAPPAFAEVTTDDADDYVYTALVVDDSAAIRKQLELELRDAQIKADFAETGEEALEKSAQKQYDLVFLDIIMPGIDGYEVCRQMRLRKAMKKTPIIMLSGKTSPLDEVKGVIAGASTYLTKPVKHEQFQQTLKRVSKWLTNFAAC